MPSARTPLAASGRTPIATPRARTPHARLPALLLAVLAALCLAPVVPRAAASPGEAIAVPSDVPPAHRAYVAALIRDARAQRLWEQRRWHLLLHYRPATFGGYVSDADGPPFFLAPDGRTDPQAELEASLAALFTDTPRPPADLSAQCTFPARSRWLRETLPIDPARFPAQACPDYERWAGRIDPGSISLIFSSYYFNNPSSMFGHTLLRFNRRGVGEEGRLLDFAVNYAAAVPGDDNGVVFAWKGVFGGYRGTFSVLPYYLKVKEYSEMESRDLWEYRLAFTDSQIDYMLRHTWELGTTWFDYYFFDENCSFHLLSLLEVADPRLHLTDDFDTVTLPTDTVRVVAEQPGLVDELVYRPSRSSQLEQKLVVMTAGEAAWVYRLTDDPARADEPDFAERPPTRRALVMDAAIDFLQFRLAEEPEGEPARKATLRALLLRRSRLRDAGDYPTGGPRSQPPERSHDTARVSFAGGAARPAGTNRPFAEVGIQAAFHDLLSREVGVAPNSQINLLHLVGRYEEHLDDTGEEVRDWRLERFALADIVSLFPITPLVQQFSWRAAFGWQRNHEPGLADCDPCAPAFVEGGLGVTGESHLFSREVAFLFLEAAAQWDSAFAEAHRAGLGLSAGLLLDLAPRWRAGLFARRVRYTEGDEGAVSEMALRQRVTLTRDLELRVDWKGVEGYREAALGLGWYF